MPIADSDTEDASEVRSSYKLLLGQAFWYARRLCQPSIRLLLQANWGHRVSGGKAEFGGPFGMSGFCYGKNDLDHQQKAVGRVFVDLKYLKP